jgi:hypothetical protein
MNKACKGIRIRQSERCSQLTKELAPDLITMLIERGLIDRVPARCDVSIGIGECIDVDRRQKLQPNIQTIN